MDRNDLISRSELKKAIEELEITEEIVDYDCDDVSTTGVSQYLDRPDVLDLIDNAPTVEPEKVKESELIKAYTKGFDTGVETVKNERPQGEWILRTDTEWHFECNQCKGLSPWKAQFCGVCGADMRQDNEPDKQITIEEYMQSLKGENQ